MNKPRWNRSESIIVDLLRDNAYHCPTVELHGQIKDDRARLTSIRRKLQTVGFDIESKRCSIHRHSSNILMRRIVKSDHLLDAQEKVDWLAYSREMVKLFEDYETVA